LIVSVSELQNLPDYKIVPSLIGGKPIDPFKVDTFPALTANGRTNNRDRVIRASLERFGRCRSEDLNRLLSRN
jgi:hypothetical protein